MKYYQQGRGERGEGRENRRLRLRRVVFAILSYCFVLLLPPTCVFAQAPAALSHDPAWRPPAVEEIKTQALAWLEEKNAGAAAKTKAEELWSNLPASLGEEEVLERLAATFALADENAKKLADLCSAPRAQLVLPPQPWLADPQTPPFAAHNMRLYYACWLVRQSLLDEAREQLAGLQAADVAAPAMLLFYQSVVYHKLLERESGLKTLDELLLGPESSPRRYRAVAKMMRADLKELEDDSLEHIARRMDDVRRRLDLGRAGPKVRKVEDGVIESLDKLIKKLEEEQQQQQQASNKLQSNNPAQDSVPMGGKGPGDVAKKKIGSQSGWGDLPPKEREEALQQIGRDLPANYRDVIEQYFKRLASEENEGTTP
ncbi:MAG: hypothetical protein IT426_09220 [Pirellulales bacterium]|nr:hypothetical protein [Pirellulales bacterium]